MCLASVLHEHTGIDVRLTRKAVGFSTRVGDFGRPLSSVETVRLFADEATTTIGRGVSSADASPPAREAMRSIPEVTGRRAKSPSRKPVLISATGD